LMVPAVTWTALEFARIRLDPGGLFGPLSLTQHSTLPGTLAAIGGPWAITFTLVVCNYWLALMLARGRPTAAAIGAAALMFAALLSPSLPWPSPDPERLRTVAAVQPGYDTAEFERPVLRNFRPGSYDLAALDLIADLAPLTHAAARRGASLVVWPEATLWVDPRRGVGIRRALKRLARESRATIVVPYFLPGPDHGATVAVDPDGSFTATQPKQRPMWFWGEDGGNSRPPRPVSTAAGAIGTTLGVDNQDPRSARLLSNHGAELVTSSTHDWKQLAPLQVALAGLHTLESHVPLVRADWRFGSVVIDRDGTTVADAGRSKRRTIVVASVSMGSGSTPYSQIGDLLGWVSAAVALALCCAGTATRLRRRAFASRAAGPQPHRPVPSSPS
jgi:apolipoprotein N-acyltransferase